MKKVMRVKAFIGECDQNLNDDQKYNLFLKHYLSKNRGTTQQDFIKYQIDYFNKSINEINNFDYQPKKEQLIKIAKSFLDKPQQIEDYVNKGIEKLKRSKSNQIKDFESLILDYKIKYEVITGKGFEVVQKVENSLNTGFYPFFHKDVFNCFELYINRNHIVEPYIDYSYLFQRLKKEKLILDIKHFPFMEWLKEKGYIKELLFEEFLKKESFRSLKKSFSIQRENNFNTVFEPILNN